RLARQRAAPVPPVRRRPLLPRGGGDRLHGHRRAPDLGDAPPLRPDRPRRATGARRLGPGLAARAVSGFAVALVLTSAGLHATWNLLAKRAGGGARFACLAFALSA